MRFLVVCLMAAATAAGVGCAPPDSNGSDLTTGSKKATDDTNKDTSSNDDTSASKTDTSTTDDSKDRTPTDPGGDGGTTPGVDCDAASGGSAGTQLLKDDLTSDKGFFAPADGFPTGAWSFAGGYDQTQLVAGSNVALFTKDAAVGDVVIHVTAASTAFSEAITPVLRQMFLLVGATVTGGQLTAYGCGAEVVQGLNPTQKVSAVKLTGTADNIKTTVLQRTTRPSVQANEEFGLKATLKAGTLTCDMEQASTATATATGLEGVKGSVGFLVRQTKATFKSATICKLK